MPVNEHHIAVAKTARYFTYGQLSEHTKHVWFACHGYGQLARSLIRKFEVLDPTEHFVVAPEGLSKFYWNGFGTKPVASWMTSEDRLHEIDDYINYLDQLYAHIMASVKQEVQVNIFGFSQGTATITRWMANNQSKGHNMILWAGPLAHDVDWPNARTVMQKLHIYFVYGLQDQFITETQVEEHAAAMEQQKLSFEKLIFDGPHSVDRDTLQLLSDKLQQNIPDSSLK